MQTRLSTDEIADALNEAYADSAGNEMERTGCAIAIEYLARKVRVAEGPSFDEKAFIARAKNLTTVKR